jgi:hypothetical protein
MFRSPRKVVGMPENPLLPWYQSTLLWGCLAAVLTIVLTVMAAMLKDLRWLLALAWPFASIAVWETARTLGVRVWWARTWAVLGALLSGAALALIYQQLTPVNERAAFGLAETANNIIYLAAIPWFAWAAGSMLGLVTGFAAGVWLDAYLKRRDERPVSPKMF